MDAIEIQPTKRGRKIKPLSAELPKVRMCPVQLWSMRECAAVLSVSRDAVHDAVLSGVLPAEPTKGCKRRILATDAVRVLAPHFAGRINWV